MPAPETRSAPALDGGVAVGLGPRPVVLTAGGVAFASAVLGAVVAQVAVGLALLGALVGLAVAAALLVAADRRAGTIVRRMVTTHPPSGEAGARLCNLVEGLCVANGHAEPEVAVLDEPGLNALVAGSGPDAVVVVTSGLLDTLGRVEIEGVVAHLLSRAPLGGAGLFHRAAPPIADADIAAVSATRYPPGLLGALEAIAAATAEVSARAAVLGHLWLADPTGGATTHPPLEDRISLLREL